MPDRAERRRQEREKRRIVSATVWTSDGTMVEAKPHGVMPDKVPGKHRWIAIATFVMTDAAMAELHNEAVNKYLDHENLWDLSLGCIDCEQVAQLATPTCPAEAFE